MRRPFVAAGTALLLALALLGCAPMEGPAPVEGQNSDRHAGYYYPRPAAIEVYKARIDVFGGADRRRRVGFVVALVNGMLGFTRITVSDGDAFSHQILLR